MNKHTRKKYPHARREVTVWGDPPPKETRVSLFDETVARLAKAEAALAEANKRIANLETALANSRAVNALAIKKKFMDDPVEQHAPEPAWTGARGYKRVSSGKSVYMLPPPPPRLTDEEVERQMYGVMADNDLPYQSAAIPAGSVRSRLLAPIAALFRRRAS
jgi:hypothetical protein